MSDLFTKLYQYRQRDSRDPLEDWLTECFAAVLRSLSALELAAAILEILNRDIGHLADFPDNPELLVLTQFPAGDAGRPDLLITWNSVPWIVFENKVAHSVDSQLDRYASWLSNHQTKDLPKQALVFLTHVTAPPESFTKMSWTAQFGGLIEPVVQNWGKVARILVRHCAQSENPIANYLAAAFYSMLESKDMANEFPETSGLSALELYLGHSASLENLVAKMWNSVCHAANSTKMGSRTIEVQGDDGCLAASRYVKPAKNNPHGWSVLETGIWFADMQKWWSNDDLETPVRGSQAFIFFGNTSVDNLFDGVNGRPSGWQRPDNQFFVCRALIDFPLEPEARGSAMIQWCKEEADKLRVFLIENEMTEIEE